MGRLKQHAPRVLRALLVTLVKVESAHNPISNTSIMKVPLGVFNSEPMMCALFELDT